MIHETPFPFRHAKGLPTCNRAAPRLKDESSPTIYRTRGRRFALFYHFIS